MRLAFAASRPSFSHALSMGCHTWDRRTQGPSPAMPRGACSWGCCFMTRQNSWCFAVSFTALHGRTPGPLPFSHVDQPLPEAPMLRVAWQPHGEAGTLEHHPPRQSGGRSLLPPPAGAGAF